MADIEDSGWVQLGVQGALAREYAADAHLFVQSLASLLLSIVPESAEAIEHGGFLQRKQLAGVTVLFGDNRYRMESQGHQVVTSRTHVVRGIALKTEVMPVEEWIAEVSAQMELVAATNARAKAALQRILE